MIAIKKHFQGDRTIWFIFFALCIISVIEVYSAGSQLSYETGNYLKPLIKQAMFLCLGSILVYVIHNVPCRFFKILPLFLWPLSVVLLIYALTSGSQINDTGRWIKLPFNYTFQPSELAKGVVVLTTALILANMQHEKGADRKAIKYISIFSGIVCLLIFSENLSTAAILFTVVLLMMFIGRVPLLQIGKLLGTLVLALALVIGISSLFPKESVFHKKIFHRAETWANRLSDYQGDAKNAKIKGVDAKTGSEKEKSEKEQRDNRQATVAKIAIATSNFGLGKMPGNSVERDYLAHAYSDFIFAIIIEETGLWGATIVAALYFMLLIRAGRIASRCERNFPAFLIMGLAILLVFQACINMMVAVGLFPVTGQPLPLICNGGTSTLITCMYFGMMLSVSRYAIKNKQNEEEAQVAPIPEEKLPATAE